MLREVEKRIRIVRQFAACFRDYRNADLIEHTVEGSWWRNGSTAWPSVMKISTITRSCGRTLCWRCWWRSPIPSERCWQANSNKRRFGLRTPAWRPLPARRFLLAVESRGRFSFAHTWLGPLPCLGSYLGVYSRLSPSADPGFRLAVFRWDYHSCSRHYDLAYLAGEHSLGHRHTRRDQHVV